MKKFLLVELTDETSAKFYCPHCNKMILRGGTTNPIVLPTVCSNCNGEIDNTGVTPYYQDETK